MRSERGRLGIVGPGQQQLGAADDHRQRVVELVAGSRGELAQGIELASRRAGRLRVSILLAERLDDALQPASPGRPDRRRAPPTIPRRSGLPASHPPHQLGRVAVAPEVD